MTLLLTLRHVCADSGQTDGTAITYEAAVAAIPTVKHVQDLVDSIPQVRRLLLELVQYLAS